MSPPEIMRTEMDDQDDILQDFLVECGEGLERLDQEFVALEKDPTNTGLIASIFRTIHTIKGTCGFLGLTKLEGVAHATESILSQMRDGKMLVTPDGVTVLLNGVDCDCRASPTADARQTIRILGD